MAASSSSVEKYGEVADLVERLSAGSALGLDELIDMVVSNRQDGLDEARNLLDLHKLTQLDKLQSPEFAPDEYASRPDQFTVLEVTNLRNEFAKKFYVHAIIAHLGVLASQNDMPEDHKQIVQNFLRAAWAFDPQKHLRSAYKVIQAHETDRLQSLEHTFAKEMEGIVPPALEQLQSLDRFIVRHYEDLRELTSVFYGEDPGFEDSVIVYDTFGSRDEAADFVNRYAQQFLGPPVVVQARRHTVLAPTRSNCERVRVISEDERVAALFQEQQNSKILARDILQNRVEQSRKKYDALSADEEFRSDAKRYAELRQMIKSFTGDDLHNEEASRHMQEYKQLRDKLEARMTPEGAVAVPCTVIGEDGKAVQKVLFTKHEKPTETEGRLKKTLGGSAPPSVSSREDRELVRSVLE